MSNNICCLCTESSVANKSLQNENGQWTETYQLVIRYFDATIFNSKDGHFLSYSACLKCWQTMIDFDKFQQSILEAHRSLVTDSGQIKVCVKVEYDDHNVTNENFSEFEILKSETIKEEEFPPDSLNIIQTSVHNNPTKKSEIEKQCSYSLMELNMDDFKSKQSLETESISLPKIEIMDVYDDNTEDDNEMQYDEQSASDDNQQISVSNKNDKYKGKGARKCELCKKSFSRASSLRRHNNTFHDGAIKKSKRQMQYSPKSLELSYKRSAQFLDNLIAKLFPKLECEKCKQSFTTFTLLKQHFHVQHPEEECYISCCGQTLNKRGSIIRHLKGHPDSFQCKICDKSFYSRKGFLIHMRMHDPNLKNVKLDDSILSQEPSSKDAFIAQLKPELECVACFKKFSTYTMLQQHFQLTHPKNEFFVLCCRRKMKDRYHFKEHLLLHKNPNVNECELCCLAFATRTNLKRHMRVQHQSAKEDYAPKIAEAFRKTSKDLDAIIAEWRQSLECPMCSYKCANFGLLQKHFRQKHPQDHCHIECCKSKLNSRCAIFKHIGNHKDSENNE